MAYHSSRLRRVEEKRALNTTIKYLALTVVIIFLLFNFGLPALSRATILLTDLAGKNASGIEDNGPPLPPPQIEDLPAYTKEKSIRVKGKTRPGATVAIFFNDEKNEVLANASGEFTSTFELSHGENTIYALSEDGNRTSGRSKTFSIILDNEPPKLEIITPQNGQTITGRNNKIQIEGATEAEAKVTINDRIVIVRNDGKFNHSVSLNEGENIFKIKSVDAAGNESELEFKLIYSF